MEDTITTTTDATTSEPKLARRGVYEDRVNALIDQINEEGGFGNWWLFLNPDGPAILDELIANAERSDAAGSEDKTNAKNRAMFFLLQFEVRA